MNWFGRKTNTGKQPSAVSSTSNHTSGGGGGAAASRTTTANTVVTLRESIATQEKRWVWNIYTYFLPYYVYEGEGGNIYITLWSLFTRQKSHIFLFATFY